MYEPVEQPKRPLWKTLMFSALVCVPMVGLGILIHSIITMTPAAKKTVPDVVQVKFVKPPPPPPPPPPPKVVEQRPQEVKQEFKAEVKPVQNDPPPPGPPALAGPGEGPPNAFGLVGGGTGDWGTGGGGTAAAGYEWYGGLSVARGEAALQKQRKLSGQRYQVVVELWLSPDGAIDHVDVVKSSGKSEVDQVIEETLTAMAKLPQPPPKDMPMPVVLRYAAT